MAQTFARKLAFVLTALSLSRGRVAARVGVDKSAVGRWVTGAVRPSAESLARLTSVVAEQAPGFAVVDWERSIEHLAEMLGVSPRSVPGSRAARLADSLPARLVEEILEITERRGAAYEGFFRSTRGYAQHPGQFIHDQFWIRKNADGLLCFDMGTGGVLAKGCILPQHNQLFAIGTEQTSGALAFGIFNGVNTRQAGRLDGLILNCALDAGRTPTACAVVLERVAELSGDPAADQARFAEVAQLDPLAAAESVPEDLRRHLVREIGDAALAAGGDWLLRAPLARSLSSGLGL